MDSDVEVREVMPGEYDVRLGGRRLRVLIPAGIGVPGVGDDELAGALIVELVARGTEPPGVVDASSVLRDDPGLLDAVAERCDPEA